MTRIVAISDTHTLQNQMELPEADILIHAGDMGGRGSSHEYFEIGNWFKKLKSKFKHRIIVPGNHDGAFQRNAEAVMRDWFDDGVILLLDKGIELEGIKFYGCPWMNQFYNWAFMRDSEAELAQDYAKINDDTQVLITHAPPYGILDKNSNPHDDRCGSKALYQRIKELPKLQHHIFGHIHASHGQVTIGDVTFHNVAMLNEMYLHTNQATIIEV